MIESGRSQRSVALQLGYSRRAIQNLWKGYQETGSVSWRSGSGRIRATTAQEDRYVRLTARRDRNVTARALQNRLHQTTGTLASDQTIRNRLHKDQQRSRRPVTCTKLTGPHRANPLRFARQHLEWGMEEWRKVPFTDECKVKFSSEDRRMQVWRRSGERVSEPCFTNVTGMVVQMLWSRAGLAYKVKLTLFF